MKAVKFIEESFKAMLPSPFSIALMLTVVTFALAWIIPDSETTGFDRGLELIGFWKDGLFESGLLAFAVQMMLMLVLGHALALTKPVDRFIKFVTQFCTSTANAAAIVTVLTISVALFNWGLGLIFGAILARKVGEFASSRKIPLNYPLIGAAGYSGLMVWHGGISGSAPIKVAEEGHLQSLMTGVVPEEQLELFGGTISFDQTIFGTMNLVAMLALLIVLPAFMYWVGKRTKKSTPLPKATIVAGEEQKIKSMEYELIDQSMHEEEKVSGAERLDVAGWFSMFFGLIMVGYSMYLAIDGYSNNGFQFITPNFINLLLFGLCLTLHKNIRFFLSAIDEAIGGASGILIQFPLYFGIMGLMKHSGLVHEFSAFFVQHSNPTTFPIFTFFSSGLVNVFVPSGGGQWMVQGPIILQAANDLGIASSKAIMALAYGDQLTNMLQPFWALPLLGITGLKAKSILPYTVALMGVGTLLFITILLLF